MSITRPLPRAYGERSRFIVLGNRVAIFVVWRELGLVGVTGVRLNFVWYWYDVDLFVEGVRTIGQHLGLISDPTYNL